VKTKRNYVGKRKFYCGTLGPLSEYAGCICNFWSGWWDLVYN